MFLQFCTFDGLYSYCKKVMHIAKLQDASLKWYINKLRSTGYAELAIFSDPAVNLMQRTISTNMGKMMAVSELCAKKCGYNSNEEFHKAIVSRYDSENISFSEKDIKTTIYQADCIANNKDINARVIEVIMAEAV